jgi:alpha-1,2-mannosyltransferase
VEETRARTVLQPATANGASTASPVSARVSYLGIPAMAAAYAVSAAIACVLAVQSQARFVDLHVYRLGGRTVLHGELLYNLRYAAQLRFTYPPFSAVLFTAFAVPPWALVVAVVLLAGVVALPVTLYLALRLPSASSWLGRRDALRLALAAAAVAIWLEPVRTTLTYGQINLFIAFLVLFDVSRTRALRGVLGRGGPGASPGEALCPPRQSPLRGVLGGRPPRQAPWLHGAAIGLAAGIKLTPAIFAVYLLATRRYRAAATAGVVFAGTVAIGFAVTPTSSAQYWDKTFLTTSNVGSIQIALNQSLLGAAARILHSASVRPLWLLVVLLIGAAGMALAVRAGRAGDEALGYSLCAVTGLLISPISWSHHWVIAVPALLLATVAMWRRRSAAPLSANAWLVMIAGLVVICLTRVLRHVPAGGSGQNAWLHLHPFELLLSNLYVLAGLTALAVAAWPVIVPRLDASGPHE